MSVLTNSGHSMRVTRDLPSITEINAALTEWCTHQEIEKILKCELNIKTNILATTILTKNPPKTIHIAEGKGKHEYKIERNDKHYYEAFTINLVCKDTHGAKYLLKGQIEIESDLDCNPQITNQKFFVRKKISDSKL